MPTRSEPFKADSPRSGSASPEPGVPTTTLAHDSFLDDDVVDAHEHGERAAPHVDTLIGTSGSHTPGPDLRTEEPFGELPPSGEGGAD